MATLEDLRLAGFVSGRLPAVVAAAGSGLDSGGLRAARFAYERRPRNLIWEEASVDLKQLTHRPRNLVGRPGTPEPAEQSGGDPPAAPTDGGPGSGTLPARESVPVPVPGGRGRGRGERRHHAGLRVTAGVRCGGTRSRWQRPSSRIMIDTGSARWTGRWRRLGAVVLVALALMLTASACGSSSTSSSASRAATATATSAAASSSTTTTHLAKTKFVLHAGLAFGAFHRWIYKPLKAGELTHPLSHKVATIKAALAAAFTYHELKLALADAQADPTLSHLVAPITALQNKINGLGSGLKGGQVNASQIEDANGSIGSIHSLAAAAGQPIVEQTPASP